MLVEAYRSATDSGDFSLVHTLHDVLADPYSEQTDAVAALYYKKKEEKFFNLGGTSHCSCSSYASGSNPSAKASHLSKNKKAENITRIEKVLTWPFCICWSPDSNVLG